MRVLVFLVLVAVACGSGLVYLAQLDAGYVLLAWAGYTLEMTAWVFAATLFILLVLITFIWQLLRYGIGLQFAVGRWFGRRGISQIHNMTAHGLAAFEEGHWQRARKLLAKVADQSENALIFYLLCARASHALGESEEVDLYLRKATNVAPNASMAINLTQAQMQLTDGALEACLATLIRAHAINEAHPAVLKMLVQVYQGLKDWSSLAKLMPQLRRLRIYPQNEYDALNRSCASAQLLIAAEQGLESLEEVWRNFGSELKTDAALISVYAEQLVRLDVIDKAEAIIRGALKHESNDTLFELYGRLASKGFDVSTLFGFISGKIDKSDATAAQLLCAGRLALQLKLPGQAKDYLERAYQKAPSADVCLELAAFSIEVGEASKAASYIRAAQR